MFGIYGTSDAAVHATLGLHALQHRGQEACGIVSFDGENFHSHNGVGLVGKVFARKSIIDGLTGYAAVAHNRYSTTGESVLCNVQPLFAEFSFGGFAIAHNGNLTNANQLRGELTKRGCLFQSTSDTEIIIHLIATDSGSTMISRLTSALRQVEGAYSLAILSDDKLIAVRDPLGFRPLALGKLGDETWVVASESCAFDIIDAEFVREVEPGELVILGAKGAISSIFPFPKKRKRFCVFEKIYFARPDSIIDGDNVYAVRKLIGVELAREAPVEADAVLPVPDSGTPAALGYAEESGISFDHGIIRNHYIGRTFIEPIDSIRHLGVKLKHNANRAFIKGKRIILVDDSIVRGTTAKKIVEMVRAAGAKEVHLRISSPPITNCCFYGIDTPKREDLLAARYDIDEMTKFIGVDSLSYISIDGLYRAMGHIARDNASPQFCDACFSGDYPIPIVGYNSDKDLK